VIAIHQGAKGLPRTISVICDNALVTGFATGIKPVGSETIAAVCADFDLTQPRTPSADEDVPRSGNAQTAAPSVDEPPAESVKRAAPPSLFNEYSQTKRFSFFRGARR
jgi:hypothetical protein